jgi:16S rRNA (adenine1518-N6/adenine1519-N6)-dimethyltransferase
VKASFGQRRKTLANCLTPLLGDKMSKGELNSTLASLGFDEKVRGETLGIPDFARLANALAERRA